MSTNHNPENQEHVSRREAMRRGALGAAGVIAAGGLNSRVFAAEAKKTPEQIAAEEKAARDEAAKAKAKIRKGEGAEDVEGAGGDKKNSDRAILDSLTEPGEQKVAAYERLYGSRPRI